MDESWGGIDTRWQHKNKRDARRGIIKHSFYIEHRRLREFGAQVVDYELGDAEWEPVWPQTPNEQDVLELCADILPLTWTVYTQL